MKRFDKRKKKESRVTSQKPPTVKILEAKKPEKKIEVLWFVL